MGLVGSPEGHGLHRHIKIAAYREHPHIKKPQSPGGGGHCGFLYLPTSTGRRCGVGDTRRQPGRRWVNLRMSRSTGRRWQNRNSYLEVSGDTREEVSVAGSSSCPMRSGRKNIGLTQVMHLGGST